MIKAILVASFLQLILSLSWVSVAHAGGEIIDAETSDDLSDGTIRYGVNGDSGPVINESAIDHFYNQHVGSIYNGDSNTVVEAFKLPYLTPGQQVTGATITFGLVDNPGNSPAGPPPGYNVDLYGLNRVSTTSANIVNADAYKVTTGKTDTANVLLAPSFVVGAPDSSLTPPTTRAATPSGMVSYSGSNLVQFVQNQYNNAAFQNAGLNTPRYIFFRLTADSVNPHTNNNNFLFAAARNSNRALRPTLALTITNPSQGITNVAGRLQFSFTLANNAITSAGVYTTSGKLLRTLWNNIRYQQGTNYAAWDGKDDSGNAVPSGTNYQIKLINHNVNYVWDGVVGNTSAPTTGNNILGSNLFHAFEQMHDMSISGNTVFYSVGYNELQSPFHSFQVGTAQVPSSFIFGYDLSDCFSTFYVMTSDNTRSYWAKGYGGIDGSPGTYVIAVNTRTSNNSYDTLPGFSSGTPQPSGRSPTYGNVIDLDTSASLSMSINTSSPPATASAPTITFTGNAVYNNNVVQFTPIISPSGSSVKSCALSSGTMPAGLSISSTTCVISGTPSSPASVNSSDKFTVTATVGGVSQVVSNSFSFPINNQPNPATGLAVQKSGNALLVAHGSLNIVRIFDKTTGANLMPNSGISVPNPGRMAMTKSGDVWIISNGNAQNSYAQSVVRYKIYNSSGAVSPQLVQTITGFTASGALAPFSNLAGVGVSADDTMLLVADGGSSQQLKVFNNSTGASLWIYGGLGGLAQHGPNVTTETANLTNSTYYFQFTPISGSSFGNEAFIAFQSDNTFWIQDAGNSRALHFQITSTTASTNNLSYIEQIAYTGASYRATTDVTDPTRVFNGFMEYSVDYSKPLGTAGAWKLVRNWAFNFPNDCSAATPVSCYFGSAHGFNNVVKLTDNGGVSHSYGILQNQSPNRANWEVFELPTTGAVARKTHWSFINSGERTVNYIPGGNGRIYPDGTLRYNVVDYNSSGSVSQIEYYKLPFAGFDSNNDPIWTGLTDTHTFNYVNGLVLTSTAQPIATSATPANAPTPWNAFPMRTELTDGNILVDFDGFPCGYGNNNQLVCHTGYHIAGIPVGSGTQFSWMAGPSTTHDYTGWFPQDGRFDIGNNVQYAGNIAMALGHNIVYGYNGEFWKNGEASKWVNYYENGLLIDVFGTDSNVGLGENAPAGFSGNSFAPTLVYAPCPVPSSDPSFAAMTANGTQCAYLYHNDESTHSGTIRWRINGWNQISELDIPVSAAAIGAITATGAGAGATVGIGQPDSIGTNSSANAPVLSYLGSLGTSGTVGNLMTVNPSTFTLNDTSATCALTSSSPTLPAGLSLDSSSCVISGTPTGTLTSGNVFTIIATNSHSSSTPATVTLTIGAGTAPVLTYTSSTVTTTAGSLLTVAPSLLTKNANSVSCTTNPSTLPTGITFDASSCTFTVNRSTTLAATSISVSAKNTANLTASATLSFTVTSAASTASAPVLAYSSSSFSGTVNTSMTISPSQLTANSSSITNCTITPKLPSGLAIGTTTNSCTISGTPTSAVPAPGTIFAVVATNSANIQSTPVTLTLIVADAPSAASSYSSWQTQNFTAAQLADPTISGDEADPDHDGISNLMEYALGLNPNHPDYAPVQGSTMGIPVQGLAPCANNTSKKCLTLTYTQLSAATDISYIPQVSQDLTTWSSGTDYLLQTSAAGVTPVVVQDLTPISDKYSRYIRLWVKRK